MIIVGFAGKKDSGKDTGANYLAAEYTAHAYPSVPPRTMGMALPLKKFCAQWLGAPLHLAMGTAEDKKTLLPHMLWENQPECPAGRVGPMSVREVLQHWGTDILRRADPEAHTKRWRFEAEQLAKGGCPLLLVPDVRYVNEIETLISMGTRVRIVRLTRLSHEQDTHPSETSLDGYNWSRNPYTHTLDNTGTVAKYKRDLRRWFFHTFRNEL